jgi:uncharacterized protein YybS (DUF2232 family)
MYLFVVIVMTLLLPLILVAGGIKRGMWPYAVILQSVLFMSISLVVLFGLAWSGGEPLSVSILKELEIPVKTMVQNPDFLSTLGLEGVGEAEAEELLLKAYGALINLLPSTVLCWTIIFSYFYYFLLSTFKNKRKKEVQMLPEFSTFSLPRKAIYGSLIVYGLSWLATSAEVVGQEVLLLNVQALIIFVFAIQGLAVVSFTTKQKKFPKIFKMIMYLVLFGSSIGRIFLALFGFFDLLVGMRQKLEKQ